MNHVLIAGCVAQSLPAKLAFVTGQVTNRITGQPVEMAAVRLTSVLTPNSPMDVVANSAGSFEFKNLLPGDYLFSVERPEFRAVRNDTSGAQGGQVISLRSGELKDIRLQLIPLGVIAGTIFSEDGDPVSGAVVTALLANKKNGKIALSQITRSTTDDLGSYRLHGLPLGRYYVRVGVRGNSRNADKPPETRSIFFPHARDEEQATALSIGDGKIITGIDFVLSSDRLTRDSDEQLALASETATIHGVVRNAATGDPIAKARVTLTNGENTSETPLSTLSDASGNFSFASVRAGPYRLWAARPGFLYDSGISGASRSSKVTAIAGQIVDAPDLKLIPQGVISGKILEGNAPVSNAIVVLVRASSTTPKNKLAFVGRTYSNDLGEYRLFDLSPGRYYIGVSYHSGTAPGSAKDDNDKSAENASPGADYITTFYPGALNLDDAVPIEVTPGSIQTSIDVSLFRMHKLRISGKVHLPGDVHAANSMTAVLLPADTRLLTKFSDQSVALDHRTGSFRVDGVASGRYVLAFEAHSNDQYAASLPVTVSTTDLDELEVTLTRAFQVRGRVIVEAGQASTDFSALTVTVRANGASGTGHSASGSVTANGSFNIQNLQPDHYSLHLSGLKDDCYLKTVFLAAADIPLNDIPLTSGAARLELTVSTSGGSIEGSVVNDQHKPIRSATVALIPEPPLHARSDLYKHTSTDAEGGFSLQGIPPGEYKLFAWDEIAADAYLDGEALMPFEDLGQRISVQENSKSKVELNVIPHLEK